MHASKSLANTINTSHYEIVNSASEKRIIPDQFALLITDPEF
jgi:hypothetical protein